MSGNLKQILENDVISQVNGNFGRWQLRTILLIFLCKVPTSWFMACVIYTAPTPKRGDYYCKPPPQLDLSDAQEWIRISHPTYIERRTDREFRVDFCNIYEDALDKSFADKYSNYTDPFKEPKDASNIIPCSHFKHNSDFNSLVTQFDLVCSRQLLVSVTQSFHALGTLIGGIIATGLLRHISPRQLMLVGMIFQILCGNLTGLVTTFELHVFFRCLTSLFCAFMYTSGQMIFADITGGKAKTIVTTLFELFWSIGLILLPGISIFVDSWTYLYFAISSPTIILVFLHRWITDSPRWLLRNGKIDQTLKILLESAAFNNRKIPLDLEDHLKSYAEQIKETKIARYWSIWDGETKRTYIIAIHWAWVFSVMLYNAMILNIRAFGVDHLHVNTVILGFAEMMGVLIGLYFIIYTRRRWLWVGYLMSVAGILTFFIWTVPNSLDESRRVGLDMIFCTIVKLGNAASLSVLITCTGEIVSEYKRPNLMFSVVTWSRIWLLLAPFITAASIWHPLLPITVFASLAVLNGLFMGYINGQFWNSNQPRIERVPTLKTFRKNSQILLMKRNSTCSELNSMDTLNAITIADLWSMSLNKEPEQINVAI